MPVEVDRRRAGPTSSASSFDFCSDEAIGSAVNVRFSQAPAMVASARRLVGDRLDAVVGDRSGRPAASSLAHVDGVDQAGEQAP